MDPVISCETLVCAQHLYDGIFQKASRNISVGIATRYTLEGSGIESR
jgi:hypothetical protein